MVTLLIAMGALLIAIVGGVLLNPDEERQDWRETSGDCCKARPRRPGRSPEAQTSLNAGAFFGDFRTLPVETLHESCRSGTGALIGRRGAAP